jgi:hypothetical protein
MDIAIEQKAGHAQTLATTGEHGIIRKPIEITFRPGQAILGPMDANLHPVYPITHPRDPSSHPGDAMIHPWDQKSPSLYEIFHLFNTNFGSSHEILYPGDPIFHTHQVIFCFVDANLHPIYPITHP